MEPFHPISWNLNQEDLKGSHIARVEVISQKPIETHFGRLPESASSTLKKFTLFPKLALELQQLIWDYNLPRPRQITLDYSYRTFTGYEVPPGDDDSADCSHNPSTSSSSMTCIRAATEPNSSRKKKLSTPSDYAIHLPWAALAVDTKSRKYAQKRYHLSFWITKHRGLYVDLERDIFVFESCRALQVFCDIRVPYPGHLWSSVLMLRDQLPTQKGQAELRVQRVVIKSYLSATMVTLLSRFDSLKQTQVQQLLQSGASRLVDAGPLMATWRQILAKDLEAQQSVVAKEGGGSEEGEGNVTLIQAYSHVEAWGRGEFLNHFESIEKMLVLWL